MTKEPLTINSTTSSDANVVREAVWKASANPSRFDILISSSGLNYFGMSISIFVPAATPLVEYLDFNTSVSTNL